MQRPWTLEMTTPAGSTVRAAIWQRETDGYLVSIGGTLPASAYETIADTLTEAIAFAQAEMTAHYVEVVNPWGIHCAHCTTAAPCEPCARQIAAEHAYAAEND